MKPKFKPYSPEEFNRAFDKMCDELEAEFGYSVRAEETKAKSKKKTKTYHISFRTENEMDKRTETISGLSKNSPNKSSKSDGENKT